MSNEYWTRFKEAFLNPILSFLLGVLLVILGILQVCLFPLFGILFIGVFMLFGVAEILYRLFVAPSYYVITGEKAHDVCYEAYKRPFDIWCDLLEKIGKWAEKSPWCIYSWMFD